MSKPWMPLYIADYRNKTAHLSAAEHGAYLLLIMHYWVNKGLPSDENQLMRISAMMPGEWKKSKRSLQAFFYDGWRHKRIDEELTKADEISSKRRAAAEQRHNKRDANASANAEQTDSNSTHTRGVIVSSLPSSATTLELEDTQAEKACGRKKQKTPLPENFAPDRTIPRELGWNEFAIDQQVNAFCDSARAHDRRYANWQSAFNNWCRSPLQQSTGNGNGRQDQSILRAIDALPGEDGFDQTSGKNPVLRLSSG